MIKDHLLVGILWIFFCVFHSLLASGSIKRWVANYLQWMHPFYRLFYTLFATVTFVYVVIFQIRLLSPLLLPSSFKWLGYPMLLVGLILMTVCVKKYFLSLSGIKSLATLQPNTHDLKVEGVHRYVRHPLYLGTFIAIWGLFFVYPTASLLISNLIIHIYTLVGIYFEERKLVESFGDQYIEYRKRVPKLIPEFQTKRKD